MEVIKLTAQAQHEATEHLRNKGQLKSHGIRVAVIGGGCSGLQYRLGMDVPSEEDLVHSYEDGLKVIVDEKSALFLKDAMLEHYSDLNRSGFEVINPNASSTCGCGKSFN